MKDAEENSILVNTKQASKILWGDISPSAQRRTTRLANKGVIKHVREGKLYWFNRIALKRVAGDTDREQDNNSSARQGLYMQGKQASLDPKSTRVFNKRNT